MNRAAGRAQTVGWPCGKAFSPMSVGKETVPRAIGPGGLAIAFLGRFCILSKYKNVISKGKRRAGKAWHAMVFQKGDERLPFLRVQLDGERLRKAHRRCCS